MLSSDKPQKNRRNYKNNFPQNPSPTSANHHTVGLLYELPAEGASVEHNTKENDAHASCGEICKIANLNKLIVK